MKFILKVLLYLTFQWGIIYLVHHFYTISFYDSSFLLGILFFLYFGGLQWLRTKIPSNSKTAPIVDIIGGHVTSTDFSDNKSTPKNRRKVLLPAFISSIITLIISIVGTIFLI